jgi:tRNA(adenine34) deaminase
VSSNIITTIAQTDYQIYCQWMTRALAIAHHAGQEGDIPVGAIITDFQGNLIAEATNQKEKLKDPTAHAEILAIRAASTKLKTWHLNNCILYVTLEPCIMCTGAIIQARIGLLVYGLDDPKTGTIRTVVNLPDSAASNHSLPVIGGIMEAECRKQLQTWFRHKRLQKKY